MSKRWTTEELNIINEHGSTMTRKELMELLPNRTNQSIQNKSNELGLVLDADTRKRCMRTRVLSGGGIYGVGINDLSGNIDYVTNLKDSMGNITWRCPFYSRWRIMLSRCYADDRACYQGCTVSDEWRYFSNFKKWMESRSWEGKEIDKDILVPGNRVYGEEFCLLVTHKLNNIIKHMPGSDHPTGVFESNSGLRYRSQIKKDGKVYDLGTFDTVEEAAFTYNKHRRAFLLEVVNGLTLDDTSDVEATRAALLRHMELETDAYRTSSIHV
jgi:hypothetical protein